LGVLQGRRIRSTSCQESTGNGNMLFLTWKMRLFLRFLEEEKNTMKGLAEPIYLPRPKKIAGRIFLSTRGAKRMSG